jgi:hypothetical protein
MKYKIYCTVDGWFGLIKTILLAIALTSNRFNPIFDKDKGNKLY